MAFGFGTAVPAAGGASDLMSSADPLTGETDEQRRKRLLQQVQDRLFPSAGTMPGASWLGLTGTGYGAGLMR